MHCVTQALEWLRVVLLGPSAQGRNNRLAAPTETPQGPTPYTVGTRLVDVPTLRAQGDASPTAVPAPYTPPWVLPPANWADTRATAQPDTTPPGSVCTCAKAGAR
ncbi:hypothetical protein ACFWR9_32320 [Streptomyces sp. NPDC058534]|uniref:hypothetical protein n=1 Tax=Streptomyces sp. NPDC058534 TaxID=3346541 RepID=UPI00365D5E93